MAVMILRKNGSSAVRDAAAVTATRVARQLIESSRKGQPNEDAHTKLRRINLVAQIAPYVTIDDTKDLLTYLSLF